MSQKIIIHLASGRTDKRKPIFKAMPEEPFTEVQAKEEARALAFWMENNLPVTTIVKIARILTRGEEKR